MPRKKVQKKDPNDMTTEELAESVFPPKVLEGLRKAVQENDAKKERKKKTSESP